MNITFHVIRRFFKSNTVIAIIYFDKIKRKKFSRKIKIIKNCELSKIEKKKQNTKRRTLNRTKNKTRIRRDN